MLEIVQDGGLDLGELILDVAERRLDVALLARERDELLHGFGVHDSPFKMASMTSLRRRNAA